jgi:hypothetical protein
MPTRPKLAITTWDGFPDGMNLAIPAHEIKDSQARYLQDAWIYRTSLTDRRGPLEVALGVKEFTGKIIGSAWTLSPDGQVRIAIYHVTAGVLTMSVLSSDYSSSTDYTLPGSWSTSPYPLFDSKPRLNGGSWIGIATQDEVNPTAEILLQWRGANKVQYNPATVTATQGSKNVTAPSGFTANVVPGMFLLTSGGAEFVGIVASVTSDTALVLEEPALHAIAATGARFDPYMGWFPRVQKGVASVASANTSVTGANTKWKDQGVTSGHRLYRASDNLYIGTVTSVTSNTALTLTAGAAVALVEDDHFLIASAPDNGVSTLGTGNKVGFLNATYAEVQWYANRGITADQSGEFVNRLWFSDSADPMAVDLSTVDGDFIPVSSGKEANTPIKAIIPAYNSLMVLKERETFALFGNNPDNFEVRKIAEDGTLSTMSAVPYESGVLWAGREGIYYWDGVEAVNIVEDTLGKYYHDLVQDFDPRTHRMWAVLHEDHYLLHIENVTPDVAVVKGNISETPEIMTIAIYMPRRAVTVHNNLHIRGSVVIPSTQGALTWVMVNTEDGGRVCDVDALFNDDGRDTVISDTAVYTNKNLITNPSFEVDATSWWVGTGDTITASADEALFGSMSGKHVSDASDNGYLQWSGSTLEQGETYTASLYILGDVGDVQLCVQNAAFTTVLAETFTTTSDWQRIDVTYTPTVTGTYYLLLYRNTAGVGTFYVDGVQLEMNDEASEYVDGDQLYGKWTGAAHGSITSAAYPGPDLYIESKKYDIGNGMLKKLWKMLMLHYLVGGDSLKLDTVIGLNTVGSTTTSDWPITVYSWDRLAPSPFSTWDGLDGTHPTWDSVVDAIFFVKRIKFLKRSQYLAFRIYQNSPAVNAAKLGPFALAYKAQRPGRV